MKFVAPHAKEASIFCTTDIARILFECVDKGAIDNFRRFLARHANVRKWVVAADFSLGKDRPLGCFAFTIIPYDAWPWNIERDIVAALANDLKDSKSVPENGIQWLRDNRRFHFAITVRPTRSVFVGGTGTKLAQAREYVARTIEYAEANPGNVKASTMRRLAQRQAA